MAMRQTQLSTRADATSKQSRVPAWGSFRGDTMSTRLTLTLWRWVALIGLGSAGSVNAQSDQPAASADNGMEEIVVTARRREERVQWVPIAIEAFSQADLDKHHIQDVQDLARNVPSLAVSNSQSDANA